MYCPKGQKSIITSDVERRSTILDYSFMSLNKIRTPMYSNFGLLSEFQGHLKQEKVHICSSNSARKLKFNVYD